MTFTEAQQDANWDNLSPEQRTYFNGLAAADPVRTGQAFFEDTVPVELQDNPAKLEVFLNGGTVVTEEWVPARGRAGGEYVQVEHQVSDKDWSHDVSRANGGSDSADNGRWEDVSTNRSRGADNTTVFEQQAADAQAEADVALLERGTVLQEVDEAATVTAGFEAADLAAGAVDVALDFVAPVVGGLFAGKLVADQFEDPTHKLAAGGAGGVVTALTLTTPPGQFVLGAVLVGKLAHRTYKWFEKRAA